MLKDWKFKKRNTNNDAHFYRHYKQWEHITTRLSPGSTQPLIQRAPGAHPEFFFGGGVDPEAI
jgi:hypothetical protein